MLCYVNFTINLFYIFSIVYRYFTFWNLMKHYIILWRILSV
jgi:hypothetical protein